MAKEQHFEGTSLEFLQNVPKKSLTETVMTLQNAKKEHKISLDDIFQAFSKKFLFDSMKCNLLRKMNEETNVLDQSDHQLIIKTSAQKVQLLELETFSVVTELNFQHAVKTAKFLQNKSICIFLSSKELLFYQKQKHYGLQFSYSEVESFEVIEVKEERRLVLMMASREIRVLSLE